MSDIRDAFPDKVICDPNSGCWLWTGYINNHGYGQIGRNTKAYRESYILARGAIPDGLQIDHLCRVRSCVNPDHLEAVTQHENIRRGTWAEGRAVWVRSRTHCKRGHPYEGNTYVNCRGHRNCVICMNAAQARFKAKKENSLVN